ncbi:hypothetical protein CHLRE_01g025600v5 [Chlamydomonas reinhardtii]|uniref:Uncharacterized protein n=1 Tax=Chlamydomonas reinhardtii TaxID=3055 RepID=A0A2K3E6D0_CHLRE|nr:uncharacterized protein CHLRE_01g025600v5 [Chlamydomonas reinhardtii]PNW88348.1 hypothetical protein CHLRE_01g025600v5 [Chlamydomonas reinhardtii]
MATKAAAATSINLNDVFVPPVHGGGARRLSLGEGESLPSLGGTMGSAGPGPGSLQGTAKLSGQVLALSNAKERASSTGATARRLSAGPPGIGSPDAFPPPSAHYSDGPTGGQQNPRLPPLMYGIGPPGRAPPAPSLGLSGTPAGVPSFQQPLNGGPQQPLEPIQQHPAVLPSGPAPASYPYAPKRKPPSAFMRNNPLKQQLEYQQVMAGATRGAASARGPGPGPSPGVQAGAAADTLLHVDAAQHTQLANDVLAEAAAALAQGGGSGMSGGSSYAAAPATAPWGVSSVSDLEALDSILDQLVVVDARMRKALLKGPLISFETVVPDQAGGHGGRGASARGRQAAEDERDRTFLTAVKGITEDAGQEEEAPAAPAEPPPPLVLPPQDVGGAPGPGTGRITWGQEEVAEPPQSQGAGGATDSSMFPASIPNTGMHPSFTRAYLASKAAPKAVLTPPPPPATAEHLLRSRPPPFIAAPSYEELCGQIRDVQRQYTCGSNKPPAGTPAAAAAAAAAAAVGTATTNQYIAGLDGPALEDVVAQQDLPISLERVRPTFVALKHKARAPSPKRRANSPGRGDGGPGGGGYGGEALAGRGL